MPTRLQDLGCRFVEVDDGQDQVLGRNVFVLELAGDRSGLGDGFFQRAARIGLGSLNFGQGGNFLIEGRAQLRVIHSDLFYAFADDVFRNGENGLDQVQRHDLLIPVLGGDPDAVLDGLIGFQGKSFLVHFHLPLQ